MYQEKRLSDIPLGKVVEIQKLDMEENIKRRLFDIGMIEGTKIKAILSSPWQDPIAYLVRGTMIALRKEDSQNIIVRTM